MMETTHTGGARSVELGRPACLALLGNLDVGRLGVVDDDGQPVVLPVSYRLVDLAGTPVVAVRTRPGNTLDRPDTPACLEIDGVDPGHDGGWSVLVRGVLRAVEPDELRDPHPLLAAGRAAWLVLVPTAITGRRLVAPEIRWAFHPAGYA
jgi:hypothetical protein